jgi:uncharacterized protein YjiS (DUF1127 family)
MALRSIGWSANSITGALRWVAALLAVARERNTLAELDDRALKDIGLSRADVEGEIQRPIWDLPSRRLW